MTSAVLRRCLSALSSVSGPLSPLWTAPLSLTVDVTRSLTDTARAAYRRRVRILAVVGVVLKVALVVTVLALDLAVRLALLPVALVIALVRVFVWVVRAVDPGCRAVRRRQREFEAWLTPSAGVVERADRALNALCAARGCTVDHFDKAVREGFLEVQWARDREVQRELRELCGQPDLEASVRKCLPDPDGAGGLKTGTVDRMKELWLAGWNAQHAKKLAEAEAKKPARDPAAEFQKWKRFGFVSGLCVLGVSVFYAYPSATLAMAGVLALMKYLDGLKVESPQESKPEEKPVEPKQPYRRQVSPPRGWPS